jgi:hypothetical protein
VVIFCRDGGHRPRADLRGTQTFNHAPAMRCSASVRAALLAASSRSETSNYYHGLLAESLEIEPDFL